MFFNDETYAAIVTGYRLKFKEWSVPYDVVEILEKAFEALNEEYDLGLQFFVPGDTSETGVGEATIAVLGREVITSDCWSGPASFQAQKVEEAMSQMKVLPPEFWTRLREDCPQFEGPESEEAAPLLLSFGPLCYGALHVGRPLTEDHREEAIYKYTANQDMDQAWTFNGLDGVSLEHVEFDDVCAFSLSDADFEKVPEIATPSYFLVCRYD